MNLTELEKEFPGQTMVLLVNAIQRAVRISAKQHPLRLSMKDTEISRRVDWCAEMCVQLRREHRWSIERICDNIPHALHQVLETGQYIPPRGTIWGSPEN